MSERHIALLGTLTDDELVDVMDSIRQEFPRSPYDSGMDVVALWDARTFRGIPPRDNAERGYWTQVQLAMIEAGMSQLETFTDMARLAEFRDAYTEQYNKPDDEWWTDEVDAAAARVIKLANDRLALNDHKITVDGAHRVATLRSQS